MRENIIKYITKENIIFVSPKYEWLFWQEYDMENLKRFNNNQNNIISLSCYMPSCVIDFANYIYFSDELNISTFNEKLNECKQYGYKIMLSLENIYKDNNFYKKLFFDITSNECYEMKLVDGDYYLLVSDFTPKIF